MERNTSLEAEADQEALPLLASASETYCEVPSEHSGLGFLDLRATTGKRMGFFDNLKGWDKPKRFRYLLLLALSLSGDGWYVSHDDRKDQVQC